jgi:hypothetical protein
MLYILKYNINFKLYILKRSLKVNKERLRELSAKCSLFNSAVYSKSNCKSTITLILANKSV